VTPTRHRSSAHPDPGADGIEALVHEAVVFVDQGSTFERILCPACERDVQVDWWQGRMDAASRVSFTRLDVDPPCCGVETTLNDLRYWWPAGFTSAELRVTSPGRGSIEPAELVIIGALYGHPVRQVWARPAPGLVSRRSARGRIR
jgi:hypothetical protein